MPATNSDELRSENDRLRDEVEALRLRLEEAEQAIEAIRTGQVESLIVDGPNGPRIFSLEGADHAYRMLVEAMNEGAATLGEDGTILYCNARFSEMLATPIERIMGSQIRRYLSVRSQPFFDALVREASSSESRAELELRGQSGIVVPAYLSLSVINDASSKRFCLVALDLREQKRTEEIVAAERLARSVIEQSEEAIIVCDENARITRASAAAERLCGTNPLRRRFDEVFAIGLSPQADTGTNRWQSHGNSLTESILQGAVACATPARLIRSDGTTAELLISATALRDAGDQVLGCVISLVDVTTLSRAQEALQQSSEREHFLAEVLENATTAFGVGAPDGSLVFFNRAFAELTGYSREELIQRHLTWTVDLTPQEWRQPEQEVLANVSRSGETAHYEKEYIRKDGSRVPIELFVQPVLGEDNTVIQYRSFVTDITERKRAEAAQRESEERYRALTENSPDLIVRFDRDLRLLFANSAALQRLKKPPGSLTGLTAREYGAMGAAVTWEQAARRALETGEPQRFEQANDWHGQPRVYDSVAVPERAADGSVASIMAVARDITEKKRAEVELRDSEERYRHLFENLSEGFALHEMIFDVNGLPFDYRFLEVNPTFERMTGLSRERLIGRRLLEVLPMSERYWIETYGKVVTTGEAVHIENHASELGRDYEVIAFRPRPGQFATLVVDVTERKRLERLYSVLSQVNEVIVRTHDEQTLLGEVCRIVVERGGFPLVWIGLLKENQIVQAAKFGPAIGYLADIRVEVEGEFGRGPTGTCIRENRPVVNDDFQNNPSTSIWRQSALRHGIRASAAFPIHKHDKAIGAFTLYAERPGVFDAAQVKLIESLSADVSYALAAIEHERKRVETEESLRVADRLKNDFLASLSHELRNPLAPIKNSLYVLERAAPGGDQAKRSLAVISRQSEQLARLVDDLLDVTRITRNKIQLVCKRLDLNELVRLALEDQRSFFTNAEVKLELHLAPNPAFVNGDWNRLTQVVGNLLQNAAKFTSGGGSTSVTVQTDSDQAVIKIHDTGVGVAPEVLPKLFEPFMQAVQTLDRSQGGLGLGLALVKGLVELHGGTVAVHSEGLGKGTEFVVQLALAAAETNTLRPSERPPRRRRRILVIEDNIDAADTLREALEYCDHEVQVAYDGLAGFNKARELLPDVVLCDIGLPRMDGYAVARALRADAASRGLFIVALSGYAQPEDLQRTQEAGFDEHLAKPPSLEMIEELLGRLPAVQGNA